VSDSFLSQEEIDALLKQQNQEEPDQDAAEEAARESGAGDSPAGPVENLTQEEQDALGEIGNISMGSAATTLSDLVRRRVSITTPDVKIMTQQQLYDSFEKPCVIIDVSFSEGLRGSNLFFMNVHDALIIADLMMGGEGSDVSGELSEMHLSAVAEAMNQMMGSAATAMTNMFGFSVKITPPNVHAVDFEKEDFDSGMSEDTVVVISFRLVVGDLIDSNIMQVISLPIAKEKAKKLLDPSFFGAAEEGEQEESLGAQQEAAAVPEEEIIQADREVIEKPVDSGAEKDLRRAPAHGAAAGENRNLDLILDVPLRVSVVLGRSKKPIGEVLKLTPGTIVELDSLASEPVDILINGTLIAHGEVVVVNENFGVQIKNIISPEERLHKLRG